MVEEKKYNTNPLDPEFVKRADEEWEATRQLRQQSPPVEAETRHLPPNQQNTGTYSGDTRPQGQNPTAYPSVFVPPVYQPPAPYTPPRFPGQAQSQYPSQTGKPTSRRVTGVNLPENWMMALAYCPAYIGFVVSLIELFIVPRNEIRVRFHAAQGLALQIAIMAVSLLFWIIALLTGSYMGGNLFRVVQFCYLVISMIRVVRGEPNHIAALDEGTRWLNEHLEPKTGK